MKHEFKHPDPLAFANESLLPYSTISMATTEWNKTGTWRYLRPRYVECVPSCQHSCPTSNDIEAWIRLVEQGKIEEAWEAATLENPFPAIMGRVCFHPCMDGCNRREMGGSVNIKMLERALGDAMGAELPPAKPFFPKSGRTAAIIGSGPAGLACAYHLARLGHTVSVFERASEAGGMLRYGIPSYRLPREILDREISRLKMMGIEFHVGKGVRDASQLQEMHQDYAVVFMATGAQKSKTMGLANEKMPGVLAGLEFLKRAAEGKPPSIGKKVLVVGGGNTAIDTARVARRLGALVKILYRRSRVEMPAFEEEVCEAENEGVEFEMLVAPRQIIVNGGRAVGLECSRMKLGDPDESGRRQPVPIEGDDISFDADTIVTAIGEDADTSIIPSVLPIEDGTVKIRSGGRTEWPNLFAGGDFIAEPRTVVDALASGKRSAIAMDCCLRNEDVDEIFWKIRVGDSESVLMANYLECRADIRPKTATASEITRVNRVIDFRDLNAAYFTESKPNEYPTLLPSERIGGEKFKEVHATPSENAKADELSRCFHCGRCTECDNCYIYCPDVAIAKKDGGFEVDYYYCKGCGICPKECPRAAMDMIEEPTDL